LPAAARFNVSNMKNYPRKGQTGQTKQTDRHRVGEKEREGRRGGVVEDTILEIWGWEGMRSECGGCGGGGQADVALPFACLQIRQLTFFIIIFS
jgi:hypothetical protein